MSKLPTIQVKDFCRLFNADYRAIRYILEEGHVPKGVPITPATGNHREFNPGQAVWLAIVLKLKEVGLKTPLAAAVADFGLQPLQALTQNMNWDPPFSPMLGWFDTEHQYFLEVGDLKFIRFVTDANPSYEGLYEFPWSSVKGRGKPDAVLQPFVILRIDITRIARVLAQVEGWGSSHARYKASLLQTKHP